MHLTLALTYKERAGERHLLSLRFVLPSPLGPAPSPSPAHSQLSLLLPHLSAPSEITTSPQLGDSTDSAPYRGGS